MILKMLKDPVLRRLVYAVLAISLLPFAFVCNDVEAQYKRVAKGKGKKYTPSTPPADTGFKVIVYGQVWGYQEFGPDDVDWTGIDYHIFFQETSVLTTSPYWSLIGATSDSTEYVQGRGGGYTGLGDAIRDSLHANGGKALVTIFAVDPANLDNICTDSAKVQAFANNVRDWCLRHDVDGVDLDWELSTSTLANRRRVQRILYNALHPEGLELILPAGRFEQLYFKPDYCDFVVPQYYSWDQVYSGCVGGSYNVVAYANALQIGSPDPCADPSYIHGAGLKDSLRLTGWVEDLDAGDPMYHGGPGSWVHYGWPKAKMGAGYGAYATLYTALSDTVVWETAQNGWNNYATSIRIQDIRAEYTGKAGIYQKYDASRGAYAILGRPSANLNGGQWPANSLGFMTIPTNDNVADWTEWLRDEGYGAIMLYGMYEDYQPDSANGSGRFSMLETVKRTLGRIP